MLFFIRAVVAWRRFIIIAAFVTVAIVAVVSLLLPKWYTATASIFPPGQRGNVPMYAELIQNLQMPLLGQLGTGARPETIYIDMMKSRYIGERLIEEFDLYRVYDTDLVEYALAALHSHTSFTLLENGIIAVNFEARDPQTAADVANRYIALLDEFNRRLNKTRASKTREFIEEQLATRERTLADAELELKDFQETHQTLQIDEQLSAAMSIVSDLTAQAISLESQLQILEHYAAPNSEEYQQKKLQYEQVLRQLAKLKLSDDQDDEDLIRAYIPTLEEVPELALQMLRLRRNVEIENTVYTMLVREYEKSRIEEARDTPTVQVMDRASVPNLRSRPRRKILVVLGGLVGLGWSAFLAVFVTAWRENRGRSKIIDDVFAPIIADLSRLFRRKR
jgi:tyrosine-protein kinase Etk/Wzc